MRRVNHIQIRLIIDPPEYLKKIKEAIESDPKERKIEEPEKEKNTFYKLKLKGLSKRNTGRTSFNA